MSLITSNAQGGILVRDAEAELLGSADSTVRLFADASTTGGAVSAQRVTLTAGTDGASPHRHTGSAELFFVLGGRLQALAGDSVITADEGDFLLVPPGLPHAFAAEPDAGADVLIVITPGVERFDYFRLLDRVSKGTADPRELLDSQERFDNFFVESATWQRARPRR
ncbi:cupin domain-containing protein [Streptomyces sp. NPDC048685]|uniref:cupin domain-containing protein n=1 Tax=Streptomyces sp. NPDC048685 TaxID=3365584 RepID=UPI00371AF320